MARRPLLTFLALLAAPILATVIVSLVAALFYALTAPAEAVDLERIARDTFTIAMFGMLLGGYIAVPISLTFGWIVHVVLRARGATNLWFYVLCAVGVAVPVSILGLYAFPLDIVPWGLPIAALTGYFLWLIRRPDLDAANPDTATP